MSVALALAAALALASPPEAQDRSTLVLVRALAYDRALEERVDAPLVVGVLHGQERGDERVARAVLATLAGLEGVKVAGLELGTPRDIPWTGAATTSALEGLGARDLLLLGVGSQAVDQGAAVSVRESGGKLGLVVVRDAAAEQGARLSAELLELAEEVR
jgi:hypothetical protein